MSFSSSNGSLPDSTEVIAAVLQKIAKIKKESGLLKTETAYHYTDYTAIKSIIRKNCLRATNTNCLEDTSEVLHGFKQLNDACVTLACKFFDKDKLKHEILMRLTEFLDQQPTLSYYSCSFCSVGDKQSQWLEYGKQGSGFSLGFDTNNLAVALEDHHGSPIDVIYKSSVQEKISEACLDTILDCYFYNRSEDMIKQNTNVIGHSLYVIAALIAVSFKNGSFREEEESRYALSFFSEIPRRKICSGLNKKGKLISYVELKPKSPLPIKEIIVGSCLDFDKTRDDLTFLLGKHGHVNVDIKRSEVPFPS